MRLPAGQRVGQRLPRIRRQLADAERNAFLFAIELQNLDRDLVADVHHFRRVVHAAVRHVADVQQAVDAAQIDESSIFRKVFHGAGDHRAFGQNFDRGVLARLQFLFDGQLARHHDVAAAAIDLENLDRNILTEELIQIVNRPHIDLRAGHERGHADVDHQAALGALRDQPGDQQLIAHRALQLVPNAQPACFRERQKHVAFGLRTGAVDHHIDRVAGLERNCAVRLPDLLNRHQTFELVAEIDDDFLRSDFYDVALQQLPFRGRREVTIVLDEMLVVFLDREVYVHRSFIRAAGHGPELRQTVETSVLQNYTGPRWACQLRHPELIREGIR